MSNQPNNNEAPKLKMPKFNIFWLYAIILAVLLGIYMLNNESYTKEVDWTQFEKYVQKGGVSDIVVISNKGVAEGVLTDSIAKEVFPDYTKETSAQARIMTQIPSADKLEENIDKWREAGSFKGNVKYEKGSDFGGFLWSLWPILLLVAIWYIFMRRMSGGMGGGSGAGGVFSVGKSRAKLFDKDNSTRVTFNDVAGLQEAKTEVAEIVDFLKTPQKYTELGGKIPKGALLVGPPGTGKTLLAKAVAGEANVPFFSMSGSDFVEMFVGVGASRVRDLFRQAKEKAPCIVFIDEIDAVGRARGKNPNMGANDERENTLNQLLTEMDGFGTNSGVIILAATNRADILDKALLRAGRFDRQIYVDLPDLNGRKEIFKVHLKNIKKDDSVDIDLLARQTPGFSGADIANVCNEAALIAARRKNNYVQKQDFMDAVDRIVGGLEKKSVITTEEERRSIAIHEAGHATISWHLQYANPLVKVTIVPRGKALGAAWYLPEERQISTSEAMLDEMCATLGGRAAEELFLGHISSGAANDLERVTKQAYAMVAYFGMSDKLPNICYYDSTGQSYGFTKPYSEERARIIDEEVSRIIQEQYNRAKQLLQTYADGHGKLTDMLLSREVIYTDDVEHIFGKRPWVSRTDEILKINEEIEKKRKTEEAEKQPAGQQPAQDGNDQQPNQLPPATPPPFSK
ncbi:MAG TPA: ATP-dependent zinc metalloprotease FtsH [Candidatus Avimuribaculum pullicola]|nr:ATP-dependent zinc metalloprotease FtsH [Candidatus Avimuribaculum pullicola]